MNPSESAQFSPERVAHKSVIDDLNTEREKYRSMRHYVQGLGESFEGRPENKGTLPQLQRHARTITNPNSETDISIELSQAFYWGEIVGYRAGQLMGGNDWDRRSYDVLNEMLSDERDIACNDGNAFDISPTAGEQARRMADTIMGTLEVGDEDYLPKHIDRLIDEWSFGISDNAMEQHYFTLGFRHIITQITKDMIVIRRARTFGELLMSADMNNEDPDTEPMTDVIEGFIDTYIKAMSRTKLTRNSTEKELAVAREYVNKKLQRAFSKQDQLLFEDDIVIKGDALYAVCDENLEGPSYHVLSPTEKLEGEVLFMTTMEMLSVASIPLFKAFAQKKTVDINTVGINPLSLVLVLRNGVTMTDRDIPSDRKVKADTEFYQALVSGELMAVVLDNPDITISRFL